MKQPLTLILALACGFIGGTISQYLSPALVHAQTPAIPREIKAQHFVVVNERGESLGLFGLDRSGHPIIKLIDEQGRTIWSSRPEPFRGSPSGE